MKILVITPDGDIGCPVVAELLSPEFTVRVFTDDPAALPEVWHDQVEVIAGPTDGAGTLLRALADVGSVLWCLPAGTGHEIEPFARALGRAIREAGTPRLVTVTATGCGWICNADTNSRESAMEDILNKSGAAIRHVRFGPSTETALSRGQPILETGTFSMPITGDISFPLAEADDVIDAALRWLVRRDWKGIERLAIAAPRPVLL